MMEQPTLSFGPNLNPLYEAIARGHIQIAKNVFAWTPTARLSDPETSHIAALYIDQAHIRANQQNRVLAAVRRWPGYTARELSRAMELPTRDMPARRMTDLVPKFVIAGPVRTCLVTEEAATTWWPTAEPLWYVKDRDTDTGLVLTDGEKQAIQEFRREMDGWFERMMLNTPSDGLRVGIAQELRRGLKNLGGRSR